MNKYIKKTLKATIICLIVALFSTVAIILFIYLLIGTKLEEKISLINRVSIDVNNKKDEVTVINDNKIKNYPEYGTQYAYIEIPQIDVNLPVYFGDTLEILKNGNEITIKANYGEYKYKIYDMQIVKETEVDKLPIQNEKEILMVYTCYPFNNIGYATHRYVVYAELIK